MTDAELEAAIDKAGRQKVFAHAESLGWSPTNPPPKYVWWLIIKELTSND